MTRQECAPAVSDGWQVVDALPDAFVAVSPTGTITGWNVSAAVMFGWSADEALGTSLTELIVPADAHFAHAAGLAHAATTGQLRLRKAVQVQAVRRDGKRLHVELTLGMMPSAEGCYALLRDVTGRVLAEQEQQARDEVWRMSFEAAPVGMAMIDLQGRFVRVNIQLETMLGFSEEQLRGRAFTDLAPAGESESADELCVLVEDAFARTEAVKRYVKADGSPLWLRRTASLLRDASGAPMQILVHAQDVTGEVAVAGKLQRQALSDRLTGLGNRERLRLAAESRPAGCVLLLIDLDDFKRINDSLGHSVGDEVLIEVGSRLRAACRPEDLVVRLGGDEFAILAAADGPSTAPALAQRALLSLQPLIKTAGATVQVSASVGAATAAGPERALGAMLREADLAMYAVKAGGKHGMRMFEPTMLAASRRELMLENDLREAVRLGGLHLAYQPVVNVASCRISGVEALCRWDHPLLGAIPPTEFIALAERTGLIDDLTAWVLSTATTEVASWAARRSDAASVTVAVNVACSTLENPAFSGHVQECLQQAGLPAERLVVEITETGLAQSQAGLLDTVWALSRAGVRFALDDFGTGYSSLGRLAELPFSTVKLDRSFVAVITSATDAVPLVHATVALSAGLGLTVVAEGVETAAQLQCLAAAGCTSVQGYFTGRPGPASDVLARLMAAEADSGEASSTAGAPVATSVIRREFDPRKVQDPTIDQRFVRDLLAELTTLVGMESTYITRIDWQTGCQEVMTLHARGGLALREGDLVPWPETLCRTALTTGPPFSSDVPADFPGHPAAAAAGIRSYVTVPLPGPTGRLYGTLCGAHSGSVPVGAQHLATLRLCARLLSSHLPVQ